MRGVAQALAPGLLELSLRDLIDEYAVALEVAGRSRRTIDWYRAYLEEFAAFAAEAVKRERSKTSRPRSLDDGCSQLRAPGRDRLRHRVDWPRLAELADGPARFIWYHSTVRGDAPSAVLAAQKGRLRRPSRSGSGLKNQAK